MSIGTKAESGASENAYLTEHTQQMIPFPSIYQSMAGNYLPGNVLIVFFIKEAPKAKDASQKYIIDRSQQNLQG